MRTDSPAGARRWPWEGLSRNVVVLSGVSFFQDAASEMLYPVLPLFLVGVLGVPPSILGLIEGVAEGTASIMKAVSGRVADLRRRRPLVAAGYGVSSVSKLLIGLATGWPLVLVARFADRVGKGLRGPPRDALIADDTPPESRGRAFGFHRAADTMGAVVGPLLGLALYELMGHRIRPLFFAAFVPAAVSVSLIVFVRERPRVAPPPPDLATAGTKARRPPFPPGFIRVAVLLTVFGLANFSDAFLILRAKELGLSFVEVILVYALYNVSYAALSYPAGLVSDRIPRRVVFATGLVVFAVAYVGLGLVTHAAWVWLLLPIYGGYTALTDGVSRAWVADLVPKAQVGSALGLSAGLTGGASLVAGIWAGLAWNLGSGNGRIPLVVSGVAVGILAAVMLTAGATMERREK
jgi:MFS family permease